MKTCLNLWIAMVAFVSFGAEERFQILNVGTKTFTNAVLTVPDAFIGYVHHDGGLDKIKIEDLPEPTRSKYYSKDKQLAILSEKKAAAEAAKEAAIEAYKEANCRIVNGKITNVTTWPELDGDIAWIAETGIHLVLYTNRDITIRPRAKPQDLTSSGNFLGSSLSGPYRERRRIPLSETVFVICDPSSLHFHAGQSIRIRAQPLGLKPNKSGSILRTFDTGTPYISGNKPGK